MVLANSPQISNNTSLTWLVENVHGQRNNLFGFGKLNLLQNKES